MASAIDATKPTSGSATTQSVRDNFASAESDTEVSVCCAGCVEVR